MPGLERAWESVAVCHHNSIVGISRGLAVPAAPIVGDYSTAPVEKKNHSILFLPLKTKHARLLRLFQHSFPSDKYEVIQNKVKRSAKV